MSTVTHSLWQRNWRKDTLLPRGTKQFSHLLSPEVGLTLLLSNSWLWGGQIECSSRRLRRQSLGLKFLRHSWRIAAKYSIASFALISLITHTSLQFSGRKIDPKAAEARLPFILSSLATQVVMIALVPAPWWCAESLRRNSLKSSLLMVGNGSSTPLSLASQTYLYTLLLP